MQPVTSAIQIPIPVHDKKELRDYMGKIVAQTVQEIAADTATRMQNYRTDKSLLDGGIWMPNDYYLALRATGQQKRCEAFVNSNRFYHPHPPRQFKKIATQYSPSGYFPAQVILENGATPSQALKSAKQGLALLDCATVCDIGEYVALSKVIGPKFDLAFSHKGQLGPMVLGNSDPAINPLNKFRKFVAKGKEEVGAVKIGQRAFFQNIEDYRLKHDLMGEATGFNTVCLNPSEQTFVGIGLPSRGVSIPAIEERLVEEYNATPTGLESLSDELADKLYPGGKEAYAPRRTVIELRRQLGKEEFERCIRKNFSDEKRASELVEWGEKNRPISLEEIKGNREKSSTFGLFAISDFDIDIVQKCALDEGFYP